LKDVKVCLNRFFFFSHDKLSKYSDGRDVEWPINKVVQISIN